ncbi:hypothetical protein [Burkholderia stabilis]|uniref:hypothetical protein n=1 Tax=Burkholderia stabilis TaxID=95485 RepID=UPI001F4B9A56|nr:hypothetical protein [Burkholderia stabilis]
MRKRNAWKLAALDGELIDHSAFRGLAQEARATGQHRTVRSPDRASLPRGYRAMVFFIEKRLPAACETVPFGFRPGDFLRQYPHDSAIPAVQTDLRIERNRPGAR